MPLRQLIAILLTAVIFVSELSRCDTQLLDPLITMQKRPPNINQLGNNNLSFEVPKTEEILTRNPVNSSASNTSEMEIQKQKELSMATSRILSILLSTPPSSSSETDKIETDIMADSNLTSTIETQKLRTTVKTKIRFEAAALIKDDQFNIKALNRKNLMPLTTKTIESPIITTTTPSNTETEAEVETAIHAPSASVSNSTDMTISLLTYNGNEYSDEWFESLPTNPLNTMNNVDSDLPPFDAEQQAAADLLTKGFSIPTFLPPFPIFAVADLPAYLNSVLTTSTTTTTSTASLSSLNQNDMNSLQLSSNEQSLADLYGSHEKILVLNSSVSQRKFSRTTTNITVQMGSHAYMPCHIKRLQNKPVSWVRLRDGHIISVDQTTFIADQRFQAIYQDDSEYTWSLQIKYVQPNDEGWYECQVSVEPKMSAKIYLKVVVPLTELIGDQSRFVKAGSKVALHCIVRGTLEPPQYIIWFRDKSQISDDNSHGWYTQLDRNIFGNNNSDNQNTIGSLIIPYVRKADSGNYTCQPSNSAAVSVDLHVLSGEYSASAIMSAGNSCWLTVYHFSLLNIIMVVIMLWISLHET